MERNQISEEIEALRKIRHEYEQQLKQFGLQLSDLPDDCLKRLNEIAEIQSETKLYNLDLTYLDELYFEKELEHIENYEITKKLENDIRDLEAQIEKENSMIKDLQKFSSSINERINARANKEEILNELKIEEKAMEKRISMVNIPTDLNIDELISKVEKLEAQQK